MLQLVRLYRYKPKHVQQYDYMKSLIDLATQ